MKLNLPTCSWCNNDIIPLGNPTECSNCGHPVGKSCYVGTSPQRCPQCDKSPISPDAYECPSCSYSLQSRTCKTCLGSGFASPVDVPAPGGYRLKYLPSGLGVEGAVICPDCGGPRL